MNTNCNFDPFYKVQAPRILASFVGLVVNENDILFSSFYEKVVVE